MLSRPKPPLPNPRGTQALSRLNCARVALHLWWKSPGAVGPALGAPGPGHGAAGRGVQPSVARPRGQGSSAAWHRWPPRCPGGPDGSSRSRSRSRSPLAKSPGGSAPEPSTDPAQIIFRRAWPWPLRVPGGGSQAPTRAGKEPRCRPYWKGSAGSGSCRGK